MISRCFVIYLTIQYKCYKRSKNIAIVNSTISRFIHLGGSSKLDRHPATAAGVFTQNSTVVRLGLVSVVFDPPHRPGPDRFAFDVETNGKQCEKCHHARVIP